jgi:hypothetical protein
MPPWSQRFTELRALRTRGAVELHAGRDEGSARLFLVAAEKTAIAALRAIAVAHSAIASPHVPRFCDGSPDEGWIALDCDAVTDVEDVLEVVSSHGQRFPYAQGIAFNEFLMDAVEAGHTAGFGLNGALSFGNILVGERGKLWLVGFGENFLAQHGAFLAQPSPGLCVAPEIPVGTPASPASDVYVLHAMVRTLLSFVEMLPLYRAALANPGDGPAAEIHAALVELSNTATALDPSLRPSSVAALRARYRDIRRIAGTMPQPDVAGLADFLASMVSTRRALPLFVSDDGRLVRLAGPTIDLTRRRALRLIVQRLVEERRAHPDRALDIDALCEAGWAGERMRPDAARARVYVAISTLRKLGLDEVVVRRDDGYLIDPQRSVERWSDG